jgi:hypothetical protein
MNFKFFNQEENVGIIDLNDYWMYIDLGVKGLRNKSGPKNSQSP